MTHIIKCLKREKEGEEEWKYNGEGEVIQGILYTSMELSQVSQGNPLLLMYNNSKVKLKKEWLKLHLPSSPYNHINITTAEIKYNCCAE
jgi:hypothetical protein